MGQKYSQRNMGLKSEEKGKSELGVLKGIINNITVKLQKLTELLTWH
jgi:hypothetical protein